MSVSSRIRMQVVRSVAPEAEGSASTSTASTSAKLGSHTTGVADSGRWSTRRIAMYALFVALAMVTSFIEFPITPVTWLKYDPSGIVCLIAGFAYGPAAAAIVSVLGFVPHMFANPWGSLMAVLVALFLSVPAAFIYRKIRTRKGAAIGILVGAVLAIVVALVSNLIVTPIYAHMTYQAVAAMILPILLPFNVAKMAIHATTNDHSKTTQRTRTQNPGTGRDSAFSPISYGLLFHDRCTPFLRRRRVPRFCRTSRFRRACLPRRRAQGHSFQL